MVRFAIIGTNYITHQFLKAAAQYPEFKLQAVYSRTMERAVSFNQEYHAPLLFDDLDALAVCAEVDAVYIASTNYVHAPQALKMLRAGKHVLVEKPAGSNYAEVSAMVETAKANHLVWMEAIRNVYQPGYSVICENLYKLGTIRRFSTVYCQYSSRYDPFKQGELLNAFRPELSNSALMDIGVYCVHPIVKTFGRPDSVTCANTILHTGFEGAGTLILNYPDKQGVVFYSKITNSQLPSEIQGENGTMLIPNINQMDHVTIRYNDGSEEALPIPVGENGMYHQVGVFLRAMRQEYDPSPAMTASLDEAFVMESAREQTGIHFPADDHPAL